MLFHFLMFVMSHNIIVSGEIYMVDVYFVLHYAIFFTSRSHNASISLSSTPYVGSVFSLFAIVFSIHA